MISGVSTPSDLVPRRELGARRVVCNQQVNNNVLNDYYRDDQKGSIEYLVGIRDAA